MKNDNTYHRQIAWLILALLLLLRIPYTLAIIYLLPIENQMGAAIYEAGTYLLIATLIGWERNRLEEFHIDLSALFCIIFLRPLYTLILFYWKVDSPLVLPQPLGLMVWMTSIGLFIAFLRRRLKPACFTWRTLGWLAIGLLIGVCISVAENLKAFQSMLGNTQRSFSTSILLSTSINLFYHLGFAPINEEPLFRGFLWGHLRQLKWREGWILLFQAALFTSAHVYYASRYPLMFWGYIPASALLFGLLTRRSRSVTPAILAHGLINGSAYVLAALLPSYFR